VQFLLDITVEVPVDWPEAEREALFAAETVRGRELVDDGTIGHIWRIPGTVRNVSVWNADDPTALHALVMSLPSFRYAKVSVTALATHPLRGGPKNK
jgi:muconolactone D-isomerase